MHGALLRKAAVQAAHAASVANSQPWHFELSDDRLDIFADWSRQLPGLDPVARHLTMSVGCTVFNARCSLACNEQGVDVSLLPDPTRTDLMARIEVRPERPVEPIGHLAIEIERRLPAADDFVATEVPEHTRVALVEAAAAEGALVTWIDSPEKMSLLDDLARQAAEIHQIERGIPGVDLQHALDQYWTAMNDAPVGGVLVLSVEDDTKAGWLAAGQATQRVLLELTALGYLVLPQAGPIEVPYQRAAVRRMLNIDAQPVLALVIGRGTSRPTWRRRLVEVLVEH
jgi:hypothetical protein